MQSTFLSFKYFCSSNVGDWRQFLTLIHRKVVNLLRRRWFRTRIFAICRPDLYRLLIYTLALFGLIFLSKRKCHDVRSGRKIKPVQQICLSWAVWASIWLYCTKNRLNPFQKLDSVRFKMSFWYFNTYPSTRNFNVKRGCWRWASKNVTDDKNTNELVCALRLSEMIVCKWSSYIPAFSP